MRRVDVGTHLLHLTADSGRFGSRIWSHRSSRQVYSTLPPRDAGGRECRRSSSTTAFITKSSTFDSFHIRQRRSAGVSPSTSRHPLPDRTPPRRTNHRPNNPRPSKPNDSSNSRLQHARPRRPLLAIFDTTTIDSSQFSRCWWDLADESESRWVDFELATGCCEELVGES